MRIYIIRHADPDYENDTITEAGHLEAQALAKRVATLDIDHFYCSPMGRARATAAHTAKLIGREPTIEEWTRELPWRVAPEPWGHMAAWDFPGEIVRAGEPLPTHETWHEYFGECQPEIRADFDQVARNSDEFLKRHGYEREGHRYRRVRPNKEKIAVVCHGGFGLTWLAHLLEIPLALMYTGFVLLPTSVTTVLFDERSEKWATPRCIGMSDVSHLYEAGVPVSTSGIKANHE